jgi:hypothetical protein
MRAAVGAVTERNFAFSESSLPGSAPAQATERNFALSGPAPQGRGGEACIELKSEFNGLACSDKGSRGPHPRTSALTFGEHHRLDECNFALVDGVRAAERRTLIQGRDDGGIVDVAKKQRGLNFEPTLLPANFSGGLA